MAAININAGAVTDAKIANGTIDLTSKVTGILPAANGGTGGTNGGKTLAVTKFSNNTRTALSDADVYDFFNTNITQVKANSKFVVHVQLIGWSHFSGGQNFDLIFDGTTHSGQAAFTYNAQNYFHVLTGIYYIDGSSTAGSKNFKFRQDQANNASAKPFAVWNPSSSDDARISQSVSNMIFIEYDL